MSVLDTVYELVKAKHAVRVVAEKARLNQMIDHLPRVIL